MFEKKQSSQSQRAGSESTQIQAAGDVIVGITETRAREIAKETAHEVIASYTSEANELIHDRIFKLDDRVIASLIRANRLDAFSDPGFQRTYRKAQNGAASSERDSDYDMLAALIADRAARGSERKVRAGIERSIEIVDQIDDESLRGLTVFQAVRQYIALNPAVDAGLDALEELFAQLIDGPLPSGNEWMEHLDVLDAMRVDGAMTLRSFDDYFTQKLIGYVSSGLEDSSAPVEISGTPQPLEWREFLMPHDFKPGYVRIAAVNVESLRGRINPAFVDYADAIVTAAAADFGFGQIDADSQAEFLRRAKLRPTIAQISEWWSTLSRAPQVTVVGRVLARANAERLDAKRILPALD